MTDAPTIVRIATDSAWAVLFLVSATTFATVLLLRRFIRMPGGRASGLALAIPLLVPPAAAALYHQDLVPRIDVLRPAAPSMLQRPADAAGLLLVGEGRRGLVTFYSLSQDAGAWLLLACVVFVIFFLLRRGFGHIALRRMLRSCRPADGARDRVLITLVARLTEDARLFRPLRVLVRPGGGGLAFASGVRTPTIVVSEDVLAELDESELEAVLAHEIAHLRARDVPLMLTAGIFRDFVAWNPVAHLAFKLLRHDREVEADRRAAALTGRPLAVASSLVKMCRLASDARRTPRPAVGLFFSLPSSPVRRRVASLLALADGVSVPTVERSAPYAFVALVAAVIGLAAGAQLVSSSAPALGFAWGGTDVSQSYVWGADDGWRAKTARGDADGLPVGPRRMLQEASALAVTRQNFPKLMHSLTQLAGAKRPKAYRLSLRGWEAVPVFAGDASFGLYRFETLVPAARTLAPAAPAADDCGPPDRGVRCANDSGSRDGG